MHGVCNITAHMAQIISPSYKHSHQILPLRDDSLSEELLQSDYAHSACNNRDTFPSFNSGDVICAAAIS